MICLWLDALLGLNVNVLDLTVLSLKKNRGSYCSKGCYLYRGAYWNEGTYTIGRA